MHTCWDPGSPHLCLQLPDTSPGPRLKETLLSLSAGSLVLAAPINQSISLQIFTECFPRQGWALGCWRAGGHAQGPGQSQKRQRTDHGRTSHEVKGRVTGNFQLKASPEPGLSGSVWGDEEADGELDERLEGSGHLDFAKIR